MKWLFLVLLGMVNLLVFLLLAEHPVWRILALIAAQAGVLGFAMCWAEQKGEDDEDIILYFFFSFFCGVAIAFGTRRSGGQLEGVVDNVVVAWVLGIIIVIACIGATFGSWMLFSRCFDRRQRPKKPEE